MVEITHVVDGSNDYQRTVNSVPLEEKVDITRTVDFFEAKLGTSPSSSLHDKSSVSSIEKGVPWEGYLEDPLPQKKQEKKTRNLRLLIFDIYRRIFSVVFIINMSIFVETAVRGADSQKLGLIVLGNLFTAIIMRQDYLINFFFFVFCSVPHSWPLLIRRMAAKVYSHGGIHSGCGVSGTIWLILFAAKATKEMIHGGPASVATVVVTYCILALLLVILAFAYPALRVKIHDHFEATHRFMGWSSVGLLWALIILLTNDYKGDLALRHALVKNPGFWLTVILTASIIQPWAHLRKLPLKAEVLSSHCVRLYFDYDTPVPGSFARISTKPLTEWHSFATIAEPNKKGFSMVVSQAGDWTTKMINDPPKHIWVRGVPTSGVMRIVPLFRRVVVVATGSGIGPCAPHVLEGKVPIRLLWTAPNVRKTFGDKLVDSLLDASPDAVIYDTRIHGKPDMVKLVYRLVREFNAEAVCIISNKPLTDKVVYGMNSRGIPAFGAIWDS